MSRILAGGLSLALVMGSVAPATAQPVAPQRSDQPRIQPPRPRPDIQPPRPQSPVRPRPPYPVRPQPPQIVQPPRPVSGMLRCESLNYAYRRCPAETRNGVQLARRIAGNCRQGSSWGYDRRSVWVDKGCRADFRLGYGGGVPDRPYPDRDDDRGPSTGAVIAGVAVAGGLLALLASNASKRRQAAEAAANAPPPSYAPGPPAALSADLASLPAASRPAVQTCLFDAARQIGVTGGSRISFTEPQSLEPGNGGWRLRTTLVATFPDGERDVPMYCRATPTKVIALTFG